MDVLKNAGLEKEKNVMMKTKASGNSQKKGDCFHKKKTVRNPCSSDAGNQP